MATALLYKILQLFVFMIIGFILAKLNVIKNSDSGVLSKLSLYLFMPSAIINAFDFELTGDMVGGLLLAFGSAIVIHIVLFGLDSIYARCISKSAVERTSVMYPNAGNLIIPIVLSVLGNEWVVYSTAFLSVQLAFVWSHGVKLYSGDKVQFKKIIFNINIIAILLGLTFMLLNFRIPAFAKEVTNSLGAMVGPVGMLIAGILAADIDYKRTLRNKRLYVVVLLRMIVYPVIILAIVKALAFIPVANSRNILLISFLASLTPSAATVMQLAKLHEKDADFAAAVNIATTIVCVVTMPLFVAIYMSI